MRSSLNDPVLRTDLVWRPHAHRPGPRRGALVGTLLGVEVTGADIGRGTAFQFATVFGEVRTVWWDGFMQFDEPSFHDVDSGEQVLRSSIAIAWFARLADVTK